MPTTTKEYLNDIKVLATELQRLDRDYTVKGIVGATKRLHDSLYNLVEKVRATGAAAGPIPNLVGRGITITKPDCGTWGKGATIEFFDTKAGKYKVSFDDNWCGWYNRSEFKLDDQI